MRRLHVPHDPCGGLLRDLLVQRIPGEQPRIAVEREQWAVVVQHLFEMWDRPEAVDAVAAETTSQLVVNPAFGHFRQAQLRDNARKLSAFKRVATQTERELEGVRKLRRMADPAV